MGGNISQAWTSQTAVRTHTTTPRSLFSSPPTASGEFPWNPVNYQSQYPPRVSIPMTPHQHPPPPPPLLPKYRHKVPPVPIALMSRLTFLHENDLPRKNMPSRTRTYHVPCATPTSSESRCADLLHLMESPISSDDDAAKSIRTFQPFRPNRLYQHQHPTPPPSHSSLHIRPALVSPKGGNTAATIAPLTITGHLQNPCHPQRTIPDASAKMANEGPNPNSSAPTLPRLPSNYYGSPDPSPP